MKKSKFADSEIMVMLKQNENGAAVADLCREHGRSYTNGAQSSVAWAP
jgi:putative transposase